MFGTGSTVGSSASVPAAAQWIEALLTGSVGTTIAIVAIAMTGFSLLSGHLAWRRGVGVVLGCFAIFGAGMIARDLMGLARTTSQPAALTVPPPMPAPPPAKVPPVNPDPYAGASVPM